MIKNNNLNVWRWQHYTFEKEILSSMKIAKTMAANTETQAAEPKIKYFLNLIEELNI